MKRCRTCRICKPVFEFSPYKRSGDGLEYRCKSCNAKRAIDYYNRNIETARAKMRERAARDCVSRAQYMQGYRKAKADQLMSYAAKYRDENREKIKTAYDAWRKENPEKVIAATLAWQAANREKVNATAMARKAAKLRAVPKWASQEAMQSFYDFATWVSGIIGEPYHVDHIVPLKGKSVCGLHCEANLQILHYRENFSKGNRSWPDMP